MEGNINHNVIEQYSKTAATKLMQNFFNKKDQIKGSEILNFCSVQQVNYFILKALFENWRAEFDKLRSPYFDYSSREVLEASKQFMNVLSKNILVKEADFHPLVEESIYKTVLLIFSPYEYYLQEINKPNFQKISVLDLHDIRKYIKINSNLLQAYISRFDEDGIQAVFNDDAVRIFDEVCESMKETPEEFEQYLSVLNAVSAIDLESIYENSENSTVAKDLEEESAEGDTTMINEKFQQESKTLLDTLEVDKKEAIVDIHEKIPSDGFKKSITLNQRFMFEKELFNGDKAEFEMVVNYIEGCESLKEALDFVEENYAAKKKWDKDKEEVVEFLELVEKRFPQ